MKLTINTNESVDEYLIKSREELEQKLNSILSSDLTEVWLEKDKGASIALFGNGKLASLMYLPENDEVGYVSENPNYVGDTREELEIFMLHGQGDMRPAQNFVILEDGIKALLYFWDNEEKDPQITWTSY